MQGLSRDVFLLRKRLVGLMPPNAFEREKALAEIASLLRLAPLPVASKLLCCDGGSGLWPVALAKNRLGVTAYVSDVDFSRRLEGDVFDESLKPVDWIPEEEAWKDTFEDYLGIFDLGYTFGEENGKRQIERYWKSLQPGGVLLIRAIGRDILETYFHPKHWERCGLNAHLLTEREIDYSSGLMKESYVICQQGQPVEEYMVERQLYYPDEMLDLLTSTGFRNIRLYGNLDGEDYSVKSDCLLVIAEKPSINHIIRC